MTYHEQSLDLLKRLMELLGRNSFHTWVGGVSATRFKKIATRIKNVTTDLNLETIQEICADKTIDVTFREHIGAFLATPENNLEVITPFIAGFFDEAKKTWNEYNMAK